jgi:hypothetical protein
MKLISPYKAIQDFNICVEFADRRAIILINAQITLLQKLAACKLMVKSKVLGKT